jgi:hypothetical protein
LDERLKRVVVNTLNWTFPDERIQYHQCSRVALETSLVLMFLQVLGCGGPKCSHFPHAEDPRLAEFDYPLGEILLGLTEVARPSAFANARSSEPLIDVPETTAFGEPWRSLVSHGLLL